MKAATTPTVTLTCGDCRFPDDGYAFAQPVEASRSAASVLLTTVWPGRTLSPAPVSQE